MELLNLTVETREADGKGPARRTRGAGRIPAVLYGEGKDTVSLSVDTKAFGFIVHSKQGEHALVQLEVSNRPELNGPAMLKEVQHDPIKGFVLHADFLRIDLKKKIHTVVPVHLTGRAKGLLEGGVVDHQAREVEVECLALDVPEFIAVDVSELGIGDGLHVSDMKAPEGVTIITPGDRALVAVFAPRALTTETPAEEVAEPQEIGKEEKTEGKEG